MSDLHLDFDEVEFMIGGETIRAPCQVVLQPKPRGPELTFKVSGLSVAVGLQTLLGSVSSFSLHLVKANVEFEAFVYRGGAGGDEVLAFRPYRDPIVVGKPEHLASVRFDLINFPDFYTDGTENRLDIAGAEWFVQIRPPRHSPEVQALRDALYRVTHSCTVRRGDGSAFNSGTACEMLAALQDTLSFAAGRWIGMAFVTGFGNDGTAVWKWWGVGRLHPRLSEDGTWFDRHHGDALAAVVSGALDLTKCAQRFETFHVAVYWYVRSGADRGGVDGGLILLQACLERLSWQRFVVDGAACPGVRFESLNGGSRLRLLVADCGIPATIPSKLAELASQAQTRCWEDGPRAVVESRNLLVHPGGGGRLPWHQVWMLARWYAELVLLRMLRFSGDYSNRTRAGLVGDVERVPWA